MAITLPPENLGMECPSTPMVVYTDINVVPEHGKEGLDPTLSSLQVQVSALRLKQKSLHAQRREALNKILDIKGSIRVLCRVRPIDTRKPPQPSSPAAVSFGEDRVTVRSVGGARKEFTADRLFAQGATQEEVFHEVEPILRSALDGHNVCVFAYGQTGTGKTFTMEGTGDRPGIVPRSMEELFRQASRDESASFGFSVSMLEVYMGSLRDLLSSHRQSSSRATHSTPSCNLSILSGSNGSVEVEGLTDVSVADFKQAYRWYARGKRARSTSWTNVNETSSRSHCLTRITISRSGDAEEGGRRAVSKLWMVDLGGSERLLKTGATGQTLDEGKAINLSLSALADVIASLKKKRNHIPYRNSKLTQILSDSLGDDSKVLMIVHISPSEDDTGETICSLSFAKRVRAIEHNREISEDLKKQKEKRIAELNHQIGEAAAELQKVRSRIERTEELIQEKKKQLRLPPVHRLLEDDQRGSPRSPLVVVDRGEAVPETPRASERTAGRAPRAAAVPRFMASTASSRQRLSAASGDANGRPRAPRLASGRRVPAELSQSLSCSERRQHCTPSRNTKKVSSTCNSHPIFRATLHQHRRRMSDLT